MDAPPYVEEDRPPTFRAAPAPMPVAPRRLFGSRSLYVVFVVAACLFGGALGFALPYFWQR